MITISYVGGRFGEFVEKTLVVLLVVRIVLAICWLYEEERVGKRCWLY